ncbi:MAG: type IX secretion system membrane protein PorP/SprF [Chitinophagaceae bacterium]|nr:MAG: type IX secretion system membrane protein PorP/SprF [Chitinophagaceae bacterium]
MKRGALIGLSLMLLLAAREAAAQDINFSQFYELPLLRNPALAGTYKGDFRVTSAFRRQWSSVTTPYETVALGSELRLASKTSDNYMSVGCQITHDVAGDSRLTRTQALPMLAFHKSLNSARDAYLTLGVLGGFVQQRFDASGLRFSDQFVGGGYSAANPTRENFTNNTLNYADLTVGLTYSSTFGDGESAGTRYYIGAALFHLTEPRVAFSPANDIRLNKKFVFNAGLSIPLSETERVVLYADYFMQGGNRQAQGGLLWRKDLGQQEEDLPVSLYLGGFYRGNDAVVPVVKLDYHKLGFGLTYDMNVSKLKTASKARGGAELTVSYRGFLSSDRSSTDKMRCPYF